MSNPIEKVLLGAEDFSNGVDKIVVALHGLIATQDGESKITSWAQIQQIVRAGLAPKVFAIGDQLLVTKGDSTIAFDIIGFDVDTPANPDFTHSMTLQAHNTVENIMFDQAELLHYVKDNVLPAGTYKFTLLHGQYGGGTANDGTYQFTTTKDIPVGGGFRINAWGYYETSYNVLAKKIITYDANGDALESDITITAYGGGAATDLGTYSTRSADLTAEELTYKNSIEKQGGGSNNYLNSGVRQWLNSDAAANAWWSKKTVFQRKNGSAGTAGFLNGLDPEFLAIVGLATKDVKEDEVWDKGGMKTFADKFFLLSNKEIRFTTYADEGVDYPYWTRLIPVATNDANNNRIKSNTYWWTRSCHRSHGYFQYVAIPTGAYSYNNAYNTYGVVPACVII